LTAAYLNQVSEKTLSQIDITNGSPSGVPEDESDERFSDLPTRFDSGLKLSLESQRAYIRDMTNAVRKKVITGLQITGRPGVGKSHMIQEILGDASDFVMCRGLLSRRQAIERFAENPDKLFVFDDVAGCTNEPVFFQILLHALDGGSKTERVISSEVKGNKIRIPFTGSLIFIGNSAFRGAPRAVVEALESRVHTIAYNPSREEVEWQAYQLAEAGFSGMTPTESVRLVSFVLRECRAAGRDPDIRLLIERIIPIYREAQQEQTLCSWEELTRQIVWTSTARTDRPHSDTELREILRDLRITLPQTPDRVDRYHQLTGRSRATYFRDLKRLLGDDDENSSAPAA